MLRVYFGLGFEIFMFVSGLDPDDLTLTVLV